MTSWPIYTGRSEPHDRIQSLPPPPNWRAFNGGPPLQDSSIQTTVDDGGERRLGVSYSPTPSDGEVQMINAALFLRRPLLITGDPGVGKSTLAYSVAKELRLGPVLRWPITSRSTLRDGLYSYDPIGRLREENIRKLHSGESAGSEENIGRYITLGPLGTALLPFSLPRVLLIDEIDKSDIDLPNDLLNVFEEGEFVIDELLRLPPEVRGVHVRSVDGGQAFIERGRVQCRAFPFVVLTSNGEREFPPAFLRRCLRLDLQPPDEQQLSAILAAHLGGDVLEMATARIQEFVDKRDRLKALTTDQLLNAVYLATSGVEHRSLEDVVSAIMRPLTQ